MSRDAAAEPQDSPTVWTVGHSNRTVETLMALLKECGVRVVADVRRFPGSRKNPQYHPDALAATLKAHGIAYEPFPELGGRRLALADTPNSVWRNPAFRGYADYMETPAFARAIERLIATAERARTVLMCAEAVWWRCHRSLIADALKADGVTVLHIMGRGKTVEHPYTAPARLVGRTVSYRAEA